MTGSVIVVTSGKGGVGKTLTTANLGTALAQNGHKVALLDADIGLRNLDVVLGLENRIVYHLVDVVQKNCRLDQALIRDKRNANLYLLPSSQVDDKNAVSPEQMKEICEELKERFDYVLIDCPAGIEQGFRNAVAGADRALIVVVPEVSSIRDADRVIGLLSAEGVQMQIIVNRLDPQLVRRKDMLDQNDVMDILALDVVGIVPEDEHVIASTNRGIPAVMNRVSKAGQAYLRIARRLTTEPDLPLPDFTGNGSFLRRIFSFASGKNSALAHR
ncbi:MAG: septum site-determining protein MinD [Deltaproteobacteria bacterium]|nr:MAG: septum site-determining protein MinD [Deltaproteobacteria bacterium]